MAIAFGSMLVSMTVDKVSETKSSYIQHRKPLFTSIVTPSIGSLSSSLVSLVSRCLESYVVPKSMGVYEYDVRVEVSLSIT